MSHLKYFNVMINVIQWKMTHCNPTMENDTIESVTMENVTMESVTMEKDVVQQ